MSTPSLSVAMSEVVHTAARNHLLRLDGQEDICFGLWRPSTGASRTTALIFELILPGPGDRVLHGNVSFEPRYFERALQQAAAHGAGLAMLHSHPNGIGWQGMSPQDVDAEKGHAASVFGATGKSFVGLTLAKDESWSARFWERVGPRMYNHRWCKNVRVVGDAFKVTYADQLIPVPRHNEQQVRTISAWGEETQADLVRVRVGIIGGGSVGGHVAESLARTGFLDIKIIDFDSIEIQNLDRLCYAVKTDVGKAKVDVLKARLVAIGTADDICVDAVRGAVYESAAFLKALDCDVLISCVDRPWGRHVLNFIAYAHLIPVIDGGVAVRRNKHDRLAAADWRAHSASPGRAYLQCLGQYDPGEVELERQGLLDDPTYIANLAKGHHLRARENVYAFASACASLQTLQLLAMIVAPLGISNPGCQRYHFVGSTMEPNQFPSCHKECIFPTITAQGDICAFSVIEQNALTPKMPKFAEEPVAED